MYLVKKESAEYWSTARPLDEREGEKNLRCIDHCLHLYKAGDLKLNRASEPPPRGPFIFIFF